MEKCFVCGGAVSGEGIQLLKNYPQYAMCGECFDLLQQLPRCTSESKYNEIDERFSKVVRNAEIPKELRDIFREADDAYWNYKESVSSYEDNYAQALENLMLTTGSSFDGYKVVKYLDIISCEIVFKNSFLNTLSAGFEDFFRALSFKEKEMSGVTELIERAKGYVMSKFREKAIAKGANAVLGIDFETSFGSDIVKISVNGTAVVVDAKEE